MGGKLREREGGREGGREGEREKKGRKVKGGRREREWRNVK